MPNCDFDYKFQSNFIDLPFWYGCSSLNLMIIFGTSFPKITSRGLLLKKNHVHASSGFWLTLFQLFNFRT